MSQSLQIVTEFNNLRKNFPEFPYGCDAEWLRRLTRNQMGFPRAGSNPARSDRVLNPWPLGCVPKRKIGANHRHYGVEPVKYVIESYILVQLTSFYSLYCINFESFSCSFTSEALEDALVKPLAVNLLHGWRDVWRYHLTSHYCENLPEVGFEPTRTYVHWILSPTP